MSSGMTGGASSFGNPCPATAVAVLATPYPVRLQCTLLGGHEDFPPESEWYSKNHRFYMEWWGEPDFYLDAQVDAREAAIRKEQAELLLERLHEFLEQPSGATLHQQGGQ